MLVVTQLLRYRSKEVDPLAELSKPKMRLSPVQQYYKCGVRDGVWCEEGRDEGGELFGRLR
jgi:hypothetical protein